jgi:superfamily I DNA and/or RNA helicase
MEYPAVSGMCKNVYFFDHNYPELGGDEENQSSKVNKEEAKMVVALTSYLLKHGYSGDDLTIITPYVSRSFTV